MTKKRETDGGFEVNEDLVFQRRQYVVQRIGWVFMALLVLAALLGAFGRGALSRRSAASPDGTVRVEYDRFGRLNAQTRLELAVSPPPGTKELRLWIDRKYMRNFERIETDPEPQRVDLAADRITLVYQITDKGSPLLVRLLLEPETAGNFSGRAGIDGGEPVHFDQFVYP